MDYIDKDVLRKIYKKRPPKSHKYDFGYLLVIGGSKLYSGSPALSALAALRTGVDLTLIVAPKRAADIIASFSPNLIAVALKGGDLGEEHLPELFSLTESAKKVSNKNTACIIGGGAGRDEMTEKAVINYLSKIDIPAVVDADAIWAISKNKEILKGKNFVLTPHAYEFYILTGVEIWKMGEKEQIEEVKKVAVELGVTILLKGMQDIISDGNKVFLNKTGCPEMTVGGTGDTLSGICGCFLSQGINPILAASAAAYINGVAGEAAKEKRGAGLLPTDLIREIPNVIK